MMTRTRRAARSARLPAAGSSPARVMPRATPIGAGGGIRREDHAQAVARGRGQLRVFRVLRARLGRVPRDRRGVDGVRLAAAGDRVGAGVTRLKLPPYGKALLDRRRGGDHPLSVNLVYGDRWREVEPPRVALDPKDYAPGRYDFHMLAGLRVMIHDQLAGGWEMDASILPAIYGKF